MAEEFNIPFTRIHIGRFLYLLISMLLLMLFRPLLERFVGIKFLMDLFFSLVLLSGVYAVSKNKRIFSIALVLAFPALFVEWSSYFVTFQSSFLMGKLFGILFYIFLIIAILDYLFKQTVITADMLIGAICVYLLIGTLWSSIFTTLESLQPGSFRIPESAVSQMSHFFYFSFVTLTTLGYGDITPITSIARSFCIFEAIIGQLYIAILVSRLVGVHITQFSDTKSQMASGKTGSL